MAGGEVFVSDARNGRIQVFDLEGRFLRAFGKPGKGRGELGRPMNLTIQGGELYVPEYMNDRIQVFSTDGAPRRMLGEPGSGPGQLDAPGGVAFTRHGNLLVADFYNQRVQEYNTSRRQFPSNITAGIFGFKEYPLFEAPEAARQVPKVSF